MNPSHHIFLSSILSLNPRLSWNHRRMARGGLFKVLPRPAMPNPCTPCWQSIPETALWSFQGWLACRVGGLRPSSDPLDTPCRTPMLVGKTWDHVTFASNRSESRGVQEVIAWPTGQDWSCGLYIISSDYKTLE
jgi:hypothetical protein